MLLRNITWLPNDNSKKNAKIEKNLKRLQPHAKTANN